MIIATIIFLVISLALAGISIYRSVTLVRTPMIEVKFVDFFKKSAYFLGGAVIAFIAASFFFVSRHGFHLDGLHIFELIVGALLLPSLFFVAVNAFIIHYYGRNIPEKLDKWLFKIIIIGFTASVLFFFVYTNGLAPALSYPLINGISFSDGFVTPATGKPNIAFYALCILGGAILVYFICDHFMYKEYGKHGLLESTFLVAFPAGIIGARIAYVIGEWNNSSQGQSFAERVADGEWWAPLAIWEGGITILGGAIAGIAVGALWYMWRNKGKNIWLAADLIVPTILIAQAVGRWGNFFNCEVHGLAVDEKYWRWLPEIIFNNAHFSDKCPDLVGQIYVPLFFIEGIANLLGYFVLAHVFGKKLRKFTELGDLGFGYIVWYGLTRVFMEPLRDGNYKMGEKGYWSWVWALVFVIAGVLAIVVNHIVRYILKKKADKFKAKKSDKMVGLISSLVILALGGLLLTFGVSLLTSNSFVPTLVFNGFNNGLMLLILGIAVLSTLGIAIPKFIEGIKYQKTANE
ncbi:MAG: prolipoprotein diacylglyceryl transferase [Bacilli bacterium]|nr:prolipoprotein diacylglyceryl transferase [Bacilli bacterium]